MTSRTKAAARLPTSASNSMVRPVALALRFAAAAAVVVSVLLLPSPAWAAESISAYTVDAVVGADGSMRVTETIVYDFGDAQDRHGIYRTIPQWDELDDGMRWIHPINVESVSMDGTAVPYEITESGAVIEVRVGSPDVTITGTHEYTLTYVVDGALRTFSEADLAPGNPFGFAPGDAELYWDFVGLDWGVPISDVRVDVTGPGQVLAAECFAGAAGNAGQCADRISGTSVTFRSPLLLPYEALTAAVAFPGSAFTTPPVMRVESMPLSQDAGRVFFPTALVLSLVALIGPSIVILILRRRLRGVDMPGAPVRYGPPGDLRPAEIEVSLDGSLSARGVLATLLDLVARKHITVASDTGGIFAPSRIDLAWWGAGTEPLRPWEERLVGEIFEGRERASLEGYDAEFASAVSRVRTDLTKEAVAAERLDPQAGSPRRSVGCVSGVAMMLAIAAFGIGSVSDNAIFSAGLAPVFLALMIGFFVAAFLVPDRETLKTARFEAEVEGFKKFLDTDPAAARRELVQRLGLPDHAVYATMLPYAVLFDLEGAWSGAFPDLTEEQLHSHGLFLISTSAISSLTTSGVGAVAAAYTTPKASGGSGFSGGGFSGGGGGGGGGGSW